MTCIQCVSKNWLWCMLPENCVSLIAADGLTAKRWTAARIDLPLVD